MMGLKNCCAKTCLSKVCFKFSCSFVLRFLFGQHTFGTGPAGPHHFGAGMQAKEENVLTDWLHFGEWKCRDRAKNCRKRRYVSHSRKSLP